MAKTRQAGSRAFSVRRAVLPITLGLLTATSASADQFHYNNFIMGTRAMGLGGAFSAIADDASGVYYNPAGLAFALSNDISGSANAFFDKEIVYEDTFGDFNFKEESSGTVPSFFGGLQKLDRFVPGLVAGFGMYSTDTDMKNQHDVIDGKTVKNFEQANLATQAVDSDGNAIEGRANIVRQNTDLQINRLRRTVIHQASTYFIGGAAALRVTPSFSVGLGLNYFQVDELTQDYQGNNFDVKKEQEYVACAEGAANCEPGETVDGYPTSNNVFHNQNIRKHVMAHGIQPVLGMQYALGGELSLGLTMKKGILVSDRVETATNVVRLIDDQVASKVDGENTEKEYLGSQPLEFRTGVAWFASPELLWTLDIMYYSGVEDVPEKFEKQTLRKPVTNFATGVEYYVVPSFPVRLGFFTNNDARPEVDEGDYDPLKGNHCGNAKWAEKYCGQPDHIDYMGGTLFLAWVQPNSQISGGLVLQRGKGKAQKLGDYKVQDVVASSDTFAFSATHNF